MNNIELVKSAYESFGKGDMETFKSLLSDQFVFKVPGEYSHAGVFNGADDVIRFLVEKLVSGNQLKDFESITNHLWKNQFYVQV